MPNESEHERTEGDSANGGRPPMNSPKSNKGLVKFDDVPVIGALPPRKLVAKLRQIGDDETADDFEQRIQGRGAKAMLFGFGPLPPWKHTSHQYGYLPLMAPGTATPQPIQFGSVVVADDVLKNGRINIHLDRLRVYKYPGGGGILHGSTRHEILFKFEARNQLPNAAEPITFTQSYTVEEGQTAGATGQPVLIGLSVGTVGAAFDISTVNVQNDSDKLIMETLQSEPFKAGLNLLTSAQPVIKPFSDMAIGIATMLVNRRKNTKVQDVKMGLDFAPAALGVRLAQGSYIVVQVPSEDALDWKDWQFNPLNGAILNKTDNSTLPYNYLVFRITRYEE
jgi:hypothetical protein